MNPAQVAIRIPTRGSVQMPTVQFLVGAASQFRDLDIALYEEHLDVSNVRNKICREFIEKTTRKFLLFIDDDVYPNHTVLSLPDWDVPIVSGVYNGIKPKSVPYPHIYKHTQDPETGQWGYVVDNDQDWGKKQLVEIDGMGAGLLCIRRDVLENPKVIEGGPFTMPKDSSGGNLLSDDLAFCQRAKAAGYKIYMDTACIGDHRVNCLLLPLMASYTELLVKKARAVKAGEWDPDGIMNGLEEQSLPESKPEPRPKRKKKPASNGQAKT